MREIPTVLIPKEDDNKTLQGIYLEQHQYFDILWYHWPQDGFVPVEDYESIILIYNDKSEICCVCVRRGWEYKPATIDELEYPIEVGFDGTFHHPYLRYKGRGKSFEEMFSNCIRAKLPPIPVDPSKIPHMARTGEDHPTLAKRFWIPVEDPSTKAQELRSEYCMEDI